MTEDVRDSLIPYDEIVQDALRAVVGRVLRQIEGYDSLPGEHHFYITFKTQASGVDIPAHLIAKFPDEMTIVLQNRFWDLTVEEDLFSVGLSFNQTPSILTIPYAAITAFVDPSVDFGLQFQVSDDGVEPEPHDEADNDRPDVTSEDGTNVVTVDFGKKR
ncbi:hypothetical protein EEB18_008180 [Sphingopyxis sp. OPL5]|uniref:SspB family protein n=1 Tax=Sphingopyxis sp. OPL5 TaxID=2486273 RepID=UPI00164E366F|nr:ClpXP protease specificity-enhancing factor SspB [Sphingopyxis sp. OPL5]QNO28907.1 hypothetical protein EEB18_008180 [Sphingopyxis sp. OPL5]